MEPKKGYLIHVNGNVTPVNVDGYKDIQALVGGHFDVVCSKSGETSLWVNDEGKLNGMDPNFLATKILWQLNPAFDGQDYLAGPVVVMGGADDEGDTLGVGYEAEMAVMRVNPLETDSDFNFFNDIGL